MTIRFALLFIGLFNWAFLKAQVIYQHPDNTTIYDFIGELAMQKDINYNSVVLPLSRKMIAQYLNDSFSISLLSKRQEKDRLFFLKDYNKEIRRKKGSFDKRKDAFYYTNPYFQLSANPVFGANYNTAPKGFCRYLGAEANMYLGKNWGVYVSFREFYEQKQITSPSFLNQQRGGQVRTSSFTGVKETALDFTEMRGGITYDWGWGDIGLVQDHFQWGNNGHGSNIFSGKIPAMPQLKLHLKPTPWLEFNSVHAWLQSNIIDSSRSYYTGRNIYRTVMRDKYLTANFISVRPIKNLWFSFGNSTIYSDIGINPAYLMPMFFWRPVDHLLTGSGSNNTGQNGQLYFDISSRNIKGLHLYANFFIDEMYLTSALDKDKAKRRNQASFKLGGRYYNLFNKNASLVFEYTRSNPFAFRHHIPTTSFESSDFNLGHYLGDNSQEYYTAFIFKPLRGLSSKIYYLNATKGEEFPFIGHSGTTGVPFQEKIMFRQKEVGLEINYEILNDVHLYNQIIVSDIEDKTGKYVPAALGGKKTQIKLGFNIGF